MTIDWRDPRLWIPIVAATAAWLGAGFAFLNAFRAGKSLKLQQEQDARRQPNLAVQYEVGGFQRFGTYRIYGFSITLMNRSDANNSITGVSLHLGYMTREGLVYSVEVPSVASLPPGTSQWSNEPISMPCRLDANQAEAGWVYFRVGTDIIDGSILDRHTLVVSGIHGEKTSSEVTIVEEIQYAVKT